MRQSDTTYTWFLLAIITMMLFMVAFIAVWHKEMMDLEVLKRQVADHTSTERFISKHR